MNAETDASGVRHHRHEEGTDRQVVILAGGIGSRFWPASVPARPKQLLSLGETGKPLVAETVDRAQRLAAPPRVRILTGEALREPILRALPQLPEDAVWTEPEARGTGPALVWAAHRIAREAPEATMISLHSDHVVSPEAGFVDTLHHAADLARDTGLLFTIAAPPERPETGYGYIRPGGALEDPSEEAGSEAASEKTNAEPRAFRVERFQEKPDADTARRYMEEGDLWNTGIFVWRVDAFLQEVRRVAPELTRPLPESREIQDDDARAYFRDAPVISVDHAVLERSDRVAAVRASFNWDDVGSWNALARTRTADGRGNVAVGPAHLVEAEDNLIYAGDDRPVVLFGVEGMVVVRTPEATLVTTRERATHLKQLVDQLPQTLRDPPVDDNGGGDRTLHSGPRSEGGGS